MAVFRVNKTADYTVISNFHLKDKRLTLKAKGLLSVMLSLPDEWDYSIAGLAAISKENETAIKAGLKELKKYNYLIIKKQTPDKTKSGRLEYVYDIYEQPYKKQVVEKQEVEILPVEILAVENHGQLNTKELNTNISNTYKDILAGITDEGLKELYLDYLKMRKLIKSPMTDRALKMLINKVNDLEPKSIARQKMLLENAIMNNWKSVYPLKDANQKSYTQQQTPTPKQEETPKPKKLPTAAEVEQFKIDMAEAFEFYTEEQKKQAIDSFKKGEW